MSFMKRYLTEKVEEFAAKYGLDVGDVYSDADLYARAVEYAQEQLRAGK